jgi:hypothetical protein
LQICGQAVVEESAGEHGCERECAHEKEGVA